MLVVFLFAEILLNISIKKGTCICTWLTERVSEGQQFAPKDKLYL